MKPKLEQTEDSDTELIHAIALGDQKALAALYDRYSSTLFGLLLRILHSRPEAEDVLQEVFLQIWQQAKNFDETRGRAFTWMMTLTHSRAIDRLRSLDSRSRGTTKASRELVERINDPAEDAINSEHNEMIREALAEIPEKQRHIILLAYFEGLSQSEIAAQLEEPLGTIKTRARSGLIKLRQLLQGKLGRRR